MTARRLLLRLHRWVGLGLGLVIALQGATGSLLVFQREIDRALNPALFRASGPADPALGYAAVQRLAEAASGQPAGTIRPPDEVWPVWVVQPARGRPGAQTAYLDPATGKVLGQRDVTRSLMFTVRQFHEALLLRPWGGHEAVGVLGLLLLAMTAAGLWLWWPRGDVLRGLVTLRRRPAVLQQLDLHRLAGAWTGAVLLVLAFSGVVIVFPAWFGGGAPAPPPPAERASRQEGPRLDADAAVAAALAAMPGQVVTGVMPPQSGPRGRNAWAVTLRPEGSSPELRGRTLLALDPGSGAVLEERSPRSRSLLADAVALQRWLHGGTLLGWPGRILALFAGLALPALLVTGLAAWLLRRRTRRRIAVPQGEPA